MTTEIDLCNLALLAIGHKLPIGAYDEGSQEATVCGLLYPPTRDLLLAVHDWRFARTRAALALAGSAPDGWAYAYALPADCLQARRLWNGSEEDTPATRLRFTTEGPTLLTDEPTATLVYTRRITDAVGLFPPPFVEALTWALASKLALALPEHVDWSTRAAQLAEAALEVAIAAEARGGHLVPLASDLERARG